MQDTLPEGTARATQLAPSAVTASAVGGSANRSVVGRVSPTTSGSSNAAQSLAPGRKQGFPHRPQPRSVRSAAARHTQGTRAHPPIPLESPGSTPHSRCFQPLAGMEHIVHMEAPSAVFPVID